jgi:hypothetical protein
MSFEQDLARGRGRAVLHLQSAAQATREHYREPILYACCNSQRYDTQIESERSLFLLDILEATKDIAWYVPHLRTALSDSSLYTDQLFGLCARLHRHSHADFKTELYAAAEQLAAQGNYDWDENLLTFGDAEAWYKIAELLFKFPPDEDRDWLPASLYKDAQQLLGRRVARHAAPREAVAWILKSRPRRQRYQHSPAPDLNEPMPKETEALKRWLLRFRNRPYPHDPAPLLALTYHDDQRVAWRAMLALGNLTDPRIRARGLEALANPETLLYPAAVRLLARNTDASDLDLLEAQLEQLLIQGEESMMHTFGTDFRHYAEANPDAPLTPLLLRVYENTPCSFCRYSFVKLLLARNAAPTWLLSECRYDCNEDTRALGGV